jgi:hypothetical protein
MCHSVPRVFFYMDTTCPACCLPRVCDSFHVSLVLQASHSPMVPPYLCIYFHSNPIGTMLPCNTCFYNFSSKTPFQLKKNKSNPTVPIKKYKSNPSNLITPWPHPLHVSFSTWTPPVLPAACHVSATVSMCLRYFRVLILPRSLHTCAFIPIPT